jgi:uncharacterized repeat protein (TIGR03803 family)
MKTKMQTIRRSNGGASVLTSRSYLFLFGSRGRSSHQLLSGIMEKARRAIPALVALLLFALPAFGAQTGVVLTNLYSFRILATGSNPTAGLVQGSDGYFYGTTFNGGTNGLGTVFKISTNGALTTLYSFTGTNDGANPDAPFVQGSDGYFYGTTQYGGTTNSGTVFKISTNGVLTTLYSFSGGNDGYSPNGLVQGNDGYFYGTTENGGNTNLNFPYGHGTVFKISTNGVLMTLYDFGTVSNDGANPYAPLVQGSDGYFYGTTISGGAQNTSTVFKISPNGALISLYSFDGYDGANPDAALVQGSDGYLYGTTSSGLYSNDGGPLYDTGDVFKISTNGVLAGLYSFTGGYDGANPTGGLVQGSDGNLYGTTGCGGTNGYGTVFRISTNMVLTALYSFTSFNDGAQPEASLVQGSDGYFYGTTEQGGALINQNGGDGTVFKISANGELATLYSFASNNDGANPEVALVRGHDGYFYGTTQNGGTNTFGTVFKISTAGALTSLYSFTGGNDGYSPNGLVQGSDGYFYGTTQKGGNINLNSPYGYGTVFKFNTNGVLTTLYSFGTSTNKYGQPLDGANPDAPLVQGSDGYFYGTTQNGGTNGHGSVFRISTNMVLTSLYSFTGGKDGAYPEGALVQGSDGYFYGTTRGVYYNDGERYDIINATVFKINTNGVLTSLDFFPQTRYAAVLGAGLALGSDGYFYGTTSGDGPNKSGTVFKISTNGVLTTLYFFGTFTNDGANPVGSLEQGSDGSFYGTTSEGGDNGFGAGTVFRMTVVPEFQPVTLNNGTLNLTWSTEVGGRYQLQYNTDLSSSNWINLGSASTATGATLNTTDSVTNGPRRFYRLVLSP